MTPQPVRDAGWFGDWVWHTKKESIAVWSINSGAYQDSCPHGAPGDALWAITIKPVAFGAGRFGVGDDGHVYRVDGVSPRRMRPRLSHNGYEEISLRYNGDQRPFRVNRLVAEAFYGPPPTSASQCRHLDGNRRNNRPENLDWGSPAQNSRDAVAAGSFHGERASSSRLTKADVQAIRSSTEPQALLAGRHGVTQPTISKIRSGKRWGTPSTADLPNAPRWASRITLEVTGVRVQRLRTISEEDARAEGVQLHEDAPMCPCQGDEEDPGPHHLPTCSWRDENFDPTGSPYYDEFAILWNSINGESAPWSSNPWVWVIEFKRVEAVPSAALASAEAT
jgi:hypothetical protein